ncbi:GntR family transcriptional regulator [Pseudoalteromonas sp. MM1]|uniref:GntR family transcriptional regulator n=2 Tax=unclassified Pseudoalteromonas TaxID=194690 RepID=UPI0025723904|nr:GntR family transcriptional regulator [Pseudoalteromonas sp. MM1]BED91375.1 GntR family transcriptional regulator [Pseudoalteromonas sp. MM1]
MAKNNRFRQIFMEKTSNKTSAELLADKIYEEIISEGFEANTHIKELFFSDKLKVSRTPIRAAFNVLEQQGILTKKPNQGYFLKVRPNKVPQSFDYKKLSDDSGLNSLCYQIGQDYLKGQIDTTFVENQLINKYQQNRKSVQAALMAMEKDHWISRRVGYGWKFNSFISSPVSYAQSYRFRVLIESAALLEPTFEVNHDQIVMLRMSQREILNNKEKKVSAAEMFNAGVLFHETIVGMANNVFLLNALKKVNRLRRLIEYNVYSERAIPKKECEEHLVLLDLIAENKLQESSLFLKEHIGRVAKEKEDIATQLLNK